MTMIEITAKNVKVGDKAFDGEVIDTGLSHGVVYLTILYPFNRRVILRSRDDMVTVERIEPVEVRRI